MSTYEYTDSTGGKLHIDRGPTTGNPLIGIANGSSFSNIAVKSEDAPAVALTILEAAGVKPTLAPTDETPESWDARAMTYLQQGQQERKIASAKQAEREAEDAKVDAYRRLVYRQTAVGTETPADWSDFGEDGKVCWRNRYREMHDLLIRNERADEKPAPRVLQHGDPEPGRGTKWESSTGRSLRGGIGGWAYSGSARVVQWKHIGSHAFPMTEVTE